MTQRSSLLVHWSRTEIATQEAYVERLWSLLKNGLRMNVPDEEPLRGRGCSDFVYKIPMVCFTEVRLSAAKEHAEKFGKIGIVVDRQFVLDRYGGPVHYLRNHSEEVIIGNAHQIRVVLEQLKNSNLGKKDELEKLYNAFCFNCCFFKAMSKQADDFAYLDEHEWRILHTCRQQERGNIVQPAGSHPIYYIPLKSTDVRLIVVPDEQTKKLVLELGHISDWISTDRAQIPILTLEECAQF